ncbi:MAG: biotin/lipoyl-binding protein [Planctomycetota bacterium]
MRLLPTLVGLLALAAIGITANKLVASRTEALVGADAAEAGSAQALPVETRRLVPEDRIVVRKTFTGIVEPRRRADLTFEASGKVIKMHVDEGEHVTEGQVLAELDTEQLRSTRQEIESRRVRLQAQLDELLAGPRTEVIDAARSVVTALDEELVLALLQRDRRKELVERGSVSSEQLDTVSAQVRTLEARLLGARARLAELENGTREETIAAQRGALGEVDASLASIDVQIDDATLRAPFAGTIAAREVDEGAIVSMQMPTTALTLVESDVLEARIGVPVELVDEAVALPDGSQGGGSLSVRGQAIAVARARPLPIVDQATRTVTVVLELAADSAGAAGVRPGDVVSLGLDVERNERGAWIPLAALAESTRGLWSAYAAVPDPNPAGAGTHIVERVELEVLHVEAGRAYVRGTFSESLPIVATGAHRLVPGQSVVLEEAVADADRLTD